MCVWIFSATFVWNISHSKKKCVRYNTKIYIDLHVQYPLFLSDFNKLQFSQQILEKSQISNFTKIHAVGAKFHTGTQKDTHDEANSRFLQFCKCT
jgi:hypothetical protein